MNGSGIPEGLSLNLLVSWGALSLFASKNETGNNNKYILSFS
jgi:hypothetical protein